MNQPEIQVGIMAEPTIQFELKGNYQLPDGCSGIKFSVEIRGEDLWLTDESGHTQKANEFKFGSKSSDASFLLKDVTIGINFHWEQKQDQEFRGSLKLIIEDGKVRGVNVVPLEEYLRSVISSEMSATSSPELLKAHAVISRSWLMAQIVKSKKIETEQTNYQATIETADERIRWYDREDHTLFDVCADDHCQRYQGITKIISDKANEAIDATFGEFLMYDNNICDARFSKCCGGVSENFENAWEPVYHPYLSKIVDSEEAATTCVDLRREDEAEHWIRTSPNAFCNTTDQQVLSQVLPDFDQKTQDFYRWQVSYSQTELSTLIHERTGIDFGDIISMEAISRGHSGRIIKLKITGSACTKIIGKELEIRRALSTSHLYSSAFVIDHLDIENGVPQKFVLTGAGWGHGVGLCQIGAAVMGEKGYSYQEILQHYFRDSELVKQY
ncbi:SpoIID/LytB domain-containing protein [Mangrovibacterium diazotrophicum]|uniref:SpoIID/LytB domain protein n=1 Tax=Mangrovibacterium diazotrophicum TaxID=1261403 RepID=A0A419WBQ3_9BACT|nr:SpoIID/LytB domain-containing protein [Mangrovibacterium diazotrophicum]RKD92844.1 SpoIID/LytB domain protein [Mangrovibacterium diazotrophicum]